MWPMPAFRCTNASCSTKRSLLHGVLMALVRRITEGSRIKFCSTTTLLHNACLMVEYYPHAPPQSHCSTMQNSSKQCSTSASLCRSTCTIHHLAVQENRHLHEDDKVPQPKIAVSRQGGPAWPSRKKYREAFFL